MKDIFHIFFLTNLIPRPVWNEVHPKRKTESRKLTDAENDGRNVKSLPLFEVIEEVTGSRLVLAVAAWRAS